MSTKVEITENITSLDVSENITSVNITPTTTEVEVRGISIATANATGIGTSHPSDSWLGSGLTVQSTFDTIGNARSFIQGDVGASKRYNTLRETLFIKGAAPVFTEIKNTDSVPTIHVTLSTQLAAETYFTASTINAVSVNQYGIITEVDDPVAIQLRTAQVTGLDSKLSSLSSSIAASISSEGTRLDTLSSGVSANIVAIQTASSNASSRAVSLSSDLYGQLNSVSSRAASALDSRISQANSNAVTANQSLSAQLTTDYTARADSVSSNAATALTTRTNSVSSYAASVIQAKIDALNSLLTADIDSVSSRLVTAEAIIQGKADTTDPTFTGDAIFDADIKLNGVIYDTRNELVSESTVPTEGQILTASSNGLLYYASPANAANTARIDTLSSTLSANTVALQTVSATAATRADSVSSTALASYVELAGDTMTGDLKFTSTPRQITFGLDTGGNLQYKFIKGTDGGTLELGTGEGADFIIQNNGSIEIGASDELHIDAINNRVGIGTELPSTKLDVAGAITATSADINGAITAGGDITFDGWPKSDYELKGDVDGSIRFGAIANEDLSKGDVVYIVPHASQGSETRVAKAQANSSSTMPAFGLALNNVTSGNAIQVVTFGNLYGEGSGANQLDTSDYDSGTALYVSADTAGVWTDTPPSGEGNLIQNIGKVVRKQQNDGVIKVGGAGRTNATGNLNDGNIFIGNSSNQAVTSSLSSEFTSRFNIAISSTTVAIQTASSNAATRSDSISTTLAAETARINSLSSDLATKINYTDWEISQSGTNLLFKYNSEEKLRLSNSGILGVKSTEALDKVGPSFTSSQVVSVAENTAAGTDILALTATDSGPESDGTVTFSTTHASFSVDASNNLEIDFSPDFETANSFTVPVVASDSAGNTTTQNIAVTITDVDEGSNYDATFYLRTGSVGDAFTGYGFIDSSDEDNDGGQLSTDPSYTSSTQGSHDSSNVAKVFDGKVMQCYYNSSNGTFVFGLQYRPNYGFTAVPDENLTITFTKGVSSSDGSGGTSAGSLVTGNPGYGASYTGTASVQWTWNSSDVSSTVSSAFNNSTGDLFKVVVEET